MFKCANITIGISTIISLMWFMFSLYSNLIWLVGLTYSIFGFWCFPVVILTYDYVSEITYPIKESTSSALFILASQVLGVGSTYLVTTIKDTIGGRGGVFFCIFFLVLCTIIGVVSAFLIKHINYRKIASIQSVASGSFIQNMAYE